ncbi:MAG: GntR family transcriptional regulator [Phenylobacterium sp.]|nr:GntR family transcriptional regulator [Phenylobacterium sp.]
MAEDIGRSAVLRALPVFRNLILAADDGAFIGSEADLIIRIGISAPTLRQVARLLEHEELLVIKRGVGGGFFGRRPSAETVARSAALFLNLQKTPTEEVYSAAQTINAELMRRAALSDNTVARAQLAAMLDEWRTSNEALGRDQFIRQAERLTDQMAVVAGNAPLALFLRVFRYISLLQPGILSHYDAEAQEWRSLYIDLCEAILSRDPDAAVDGARRLSELAAKSGLPAD